MKLKIVTKGQQCDSLEEIREKILEQLTHISSELYIDCWKKKQKCHFNHCINEVEDYIWKNFCGWYCVLCNQSENSCNRPCVVQSLFTIFNTWLVCRCMFYEIGRIGFSTFSSWNCHVMCTLLIRNIGWL
jgi:valyl-tRNA synthetase